MQQTNESINGLVTPQSKEFEKAVLGALMIEQNAITKVITLLNPECFYFPVHKVIYQTIQRLYRENKPIGSEIFGKEYN